jgi:hypothetical protein
MLLLSSFLSVPLFEQRFIQLLQLRGDGLVATFGGWVTILELVEKGLKMQLGALGRQDLARCCGYARRWI